MYKCRECGRSNLKYTEMNVDNRGGWIVRCKLCENLRTRLYRQKHKARINPIIRARKHGLTIDDHDKLRNLHLNGCAICKRPCETDKRLMIDHNHKTNMVRGLLCQRCNVVIGMMDDNEELIWKMLEYLKSTTWSKVS